MATRWASLILWNLLLVNLVGTASATVYYIEPGGNNNNPGTLAQPWATLAKANTTLVAGDIVNIRAGTYTTAHVAPANSGTSGNPITYQNYNGETVTISSQGYGIHLNGNDYITIIGVRLTNLDLQMVLENGATYNIIDGITVSAPRNPLADWAGSRIFGDSHHNILRNSSFSTYGVCAGGSDDGSLLDIGNENTTSDESDFNLLQNNTFRWGGHHTVGVNGSHNVVKGNYFHNEIWTNGRGNRTMYNAASDTTHGARNLFHGNRYGYSSRPCDTYGTSGLLIATNDNIFRYNKSYHHDLCGLALGSYSTTPTNSNHIYNNTFFNNGLTTQSSAPDDKCGIIFGGWASPTINNVIKNNIFYLHSTPYGTNSASLNNQVFANNYNGDVSGNPLFVNASSTPPADKTDATLPNLDLQAGSPAIDYGGALTTITTASGSGVTFTVADAGYFMDGWGVPTVTGDVIQLAGTTQRATITSVNYSTKVLVFSPALTWTVGQGVSLSFEGAAPDAGAFESGSTSGDITPPTAPQNLRVM